MYRLLRDVREREREEWGQVEVEGSDWSCLEDFVTRRRQATAQAGHHSALGEAQRWLQLNTNINIKFKFYIEWNQSADTSRVYEFETLGNGHASALKFGIGENNWAKTPSGAAGDSRHQTKVEPWIFLKTPSALLHKSVSVWIFYSKFL